MKLTKREARRYALECAAAQLKCTRLTSYEGTPLVEGDEDTGEAWLLLNEARDVVARQLAVRAGVDFASLYWESDE